MHVVPIVVPVFALIALGFVAARFRFISSDTHRGVSEFTFSFALPALLFRTLATPQDIAVAPLPIWIAYFGAIAVTWGIATAVTRQVLRRPAVDAPSIAMASVYGNIVMLGIPILIAMHDAAAAAPMAVILMINTPMLWLAGTFHLAFVDNANERSLAVAARSVLLDLARNPLIVAIALGGLWRLTGLGLAAPMDKSLSLLSQAGIPAALFVLGASLAGFEIKGQAPTLTAILILKLLIMPLVAWTLATYIVSLPPIARDVVTIFAASPAGANAYLFATRSGRVVNSASGAVALGTVLSVALMSALVAGLAR
jgi:predicted permease